MDNLQIFKNENFGEIRTVIIDTEPMFCLADVCKALEISNPSKVAQRLDEDERTKLELGRAGETNFITESGLYAVVLRSDKPNARSFRKWVTSEVLPSIRKNGGYLAGRENDPPEVVIAKALVVAQNVIKQNEQRIAELTPKADYFDALVDRNLLTNLRDTAKELGIKQKQFIKWLEEKRFIYRDMRNDIKPFAPYITGDKKYFEIKEWQAGYTSGTQTLVTPRGREAFRLLLKV